VTTFGILWKCLPCFLFVGYGVYLLLVALVPSWRESGWNHWKVYDKDTNPNSWLVALGFVKAPRVIKEGDYSPRVAALRYLFIGMALILMGILGIIWLAYLHPGG